MGNFSLSKNTIDLVQKARAEGPGERNSNYRNAYSAIYSEIKDKTDIGAHPQPRSGATSEDKAARDVRNGFVHNSATSKISFSDNTPNNTDFASVQMGSFATGGIRPGEFQLGPNAKPGPYLSQRFVEPSANPNALSLNAATLKAFPR